LKNRRSASKQNCEKEKERLAKQHTEIKKPAKKNKTALPEQCFDQISINNLSDRKKRIRKRIKRISVIEK
jgi:hypothetical protein